MITLNEKTNLQEEYFYQDIINKLHQKRNKDIDKIINPSMSLIEELMDAFGNPYEIVMFRNKGSDWVMDSPISKVGRLDSDYLVLFNGESRFYVPINSTILTIENRGNKGIWMGFRCDDGVNVYISLK